MKYELEVLESLVLNDIEPSKIITKNIEEKKIREWSYIVETETERINSCLEKALFSIKKEKHVKRFIQHHQQTLVFLSDKLLEFSSPENLSILYKTGKQIPIVDLYRFIYVSIEELLSYIQNNFSSYIDQSSKVPESIRIKLIRVINERLPSISDKLKRKGADKNLIEIILDPLEHFVNNKFEKNISYRHLIYTRTIFRELINLSYSKYNQRSLNYEILVTLVHLNFNSIKFFNYCTTSITNHFRKADTLCGQLEKLAWINKKICQIQVKPGYVYNSELEPLKRSLINWIQNEIYFLETRQHLTQNYHIPGKEPQFKDFKINTSLSVSQLAYLIRLLQETGVIQNKNQKELLRFISQYFRTKKAENISAHSLRMKYYNVENNTSSTLKDVVINLFNKINQ